MWITAEVALSGLEILPDSRASGRRRPSSPPTSIARCTSLGMNLLVVDPAGKSISWMQATGHGVPACAALPGFPNSLLAGGTAMRIAEVIGRVTLSRFHPEPARRAVPARAAHAAGRPDRRLPGAGRGAGGLRQPRRRPRRLIGVSEGREAANPFGKNKTPVDAFCACLIDTLSL